MADIHRTVMDTEITRADSEAVVEATVEVMVEATEDSTAHLRGTHMRTIHVGRVVQGLEVWGCLFSEDWQADYSSETCWTVGLVGGISEGAISEVVVSSELYFRTLATFVLVHEALKYTQRDVCKYFYRYNEVDLNILWES
jgi:hypothetical protein